MKLTLLKKRKVSWGGGCGCLDSRDEIVVYDPVLLGILVVGNR